MDGEDARPAFFGGLIAAVVIALFGILGPHGGSVWQLPNGLQRSVEAALARANVGGVEVSMEGQTAVLAGIVQDNATIWRAQRATLVAAGSGGPWAGGVTVIDIRDVKVGTIERPFNWRIARQDNQVTLSGAAPSDGARAALLERARSAFPNAQIIDQMHVAGGAPSGPWRLLALDAISQLALLTSGEARFTGARLVVLGSGPREAVDRVRRHYDEAAPQPYRARADITVSGEPLAIPELSDLDLTSGRAEVCGQAFTRLMAHNVINFASGSADLDRDSLQLLDRLASVALRCDRYEIEVAGHTDNQGDRGANLDLSRRRAETVVNYLADLNVARERLRAVGFGPDQPVADNGTPAGQAANRRIVFTVRG
jgi:OOP family OmpA-OmpF porin